MDMFSRLRELSSVLKVSNLYQQVADEVITFVFFICPKMKGQGFRINSNKTGFDAEYVPAVLANSAILAIERATRFLSEFETLGLPFMSRALYASADALILPSVPTTPPATPVSLDVEIVSNDQAVIEHLTDFGRLYREKPWRNTPQKISDLERQRLISILPSNTPTNVACDFVERTWSGFALDGVLIRSECFGPNPVLLGVESPGVSVLQNAALPRDQWLPVIQLV